MKNDIEIFIKELEETVLRLHVDEIRKSGENGGYKKIIDKIEKKGVSLISQKDKEMISIWADKRFYRGKMMAYLFCLEQLGYKDVPKLMERLENWKRVEREGETIKIIAKLNNVNEK